MAAERSATNNDTSATAEKIVHALNVLSYIENEIDTLSQVAEVLGHMGSTPNDIDPQVFLLFRDVVAKSKNNLEGCWEQSIGLLREAAGLPTKG